MAKKNKEYWAERALQRENEAALRGTALTEQMYDQYRKAAKEIRKSIDTFILKYGQKYGMTYNQAAKVLSRKEMQEWKKTLREYVEEIKSTADNAQKRRMAARLNALSANSSIRRLDALMVEIECILTGLCSDTERDARKELGELFQDSYYKKVYDIQSRAGYINKFAHLDEKAVEDILSYPWSGANFSERLWKNRDNLAFNLRETLASGFIQGTSIAEMAKNLSDAMGKGFSAAETLIRTECSWLHGAANQRAYEAANIEEYEFMATLDSRTSKTCADLDGEHFPVKDAQVGVNYPPMHPRCRSTTVEYDPEEASDWFNSGKEMPKNMTYEEWCEVQAIKDAAKRQAAEKEAVARKRKADIIKLAKENKIRGEVHLEYQHTDISEYTFDEKHINKEREHGVTREDAEKFITESKVMISRWKGRFECYFAPEGATYIDLQDKNIRTSFRREEFDSATLAFVEGVEKLL